MGLSDFDSMREHIGHDIVCVRYGQGDECVNVSIECETCDCVLIDLNESQKVCIEFNECFAQCGTCERTFTTVTNEKGDTECPHCGSGNWVFGYIDDPE